jgi:hypothetical protein
MASLQSATHLCVTAKAAAFRPVPEVLRRPARATLTDGFLCRFLLQLDRALAVPAATAVRRATAPAISRQGMFTAGVMASLAYVALSVSRLISLKVVEGLCPPSRQRSTVTMLRIVAVVDVAIKAVTAVEPGAGANKQPAHKPIRPIVAVGRTLIRDVVEVPVGAHRRYSNVDGNLGWCQGCAA